MLTNRNLRWAGAGISNGRRRLASPSLRARSFSARAMIRPTRSLPISNSNSSQQTRSISLFGWNKPTTSATETSQTPTITTSEVDIGDGSISTIRTFKASHATSDAPDPSTGPHLPSSFEPEIVERAQEAITFPTDSGKASEILHGETDIVSLPERIGYLKEDCGLDYGWGTTTLIESFFEHLHITAGLSWSASIIALALLSRLVLVKPMISAQRESTKMRELQPVVAPIRERVQEHIKTGDRQQQMQASAELRAVYKEYDVKLIRAFIPILLQFPLQFGAFRMLRAAAQLPVPAFVHESWLWNNDLTFSDPYFLSPAISAGILWLQFKRTGSMSAGGPMSPQLIKVIGTALPAVSFIFMSFQPGAVQLYFVVTSLGAFLTSEALRAAPVRRYFALGDLPKPGGNTPPSPAQQKKTAMEVSGLKLKSQGVTASEQLEPTESDRSFLDRKIDEAKDKWASAKSSMASKVKEDPNKARRQQAKQYEHDRQQQLAVEREERNRAAREKMGQR